MKMAKAPEYHQVQETFHPNVAVNLMMYQNMAAYIDIVIK